MTHDYSHQSTKEDPRMMAFFDSLVQREIEDWSSEDVTAPQTPSDNDNSIVNNSFNATDSDGKLLLILIYIFVKLNLLFTFLLKYVNNKSNIRNLIIPSHRFDCF